MTEAFDLTEVAHFAFRVAGWEEVDFVGACHHSLGRVRGNFVGAGKYSGGDCGPSEVLSSFEALDWDWTGYRASQETSQCYLREARHSSKCDER
jgi:hypothetical protein